MIRPLARTYLLTAATLVFAAALAAPLSAQGQPGGFSLPPPSPTPTPAPQGPEDERAGVVIPPRSAPVPRIAPAPVLTPEPIPSPTPRSLTPVPPRTAPRGVATPVPAPAQAPTTGGTPQNTAAPTPLPSPSDPLAVPPALPLPVPDAPVPSLNVPADTAATIPALPTWWPWAAGGLGGLALLGIGGLLWRRRKPRALQLAAPPPGMANEAPAPEPARIDRALDVVLEVTGATRSVMMFTLHYRLTLANRTGQAINDVNIAALLACARHGTGNAAAPGAAQRLERIDRVGPHQNLALTGNVQLPLSAIAPLYQGQVPMFIPLVHVTLESEGQSALTRSFVIGTPNAAGTGRLHPILLNTPPGSITGLAAQRIAVPEISAAA